MVESDEDWTEKIGWEVRGQVSLVIVAKKRQHIQACGGKNILLRLPFWNVADTASSSVAQGPGRHRLGGWAWYEGGRLLLLCNPKRTWMMSWGLHVLASENRFMHCIVIHTHEGCIPR